MVGRDRRGLPLGVRIHVLTAVTRPENLTEIAYSVRNAASRADADLVWHLRFDPEHRHIGGQQVKNEILDSIEDGWVYILDDDTLVHGDLFTHLDPAYDALVVSMQLDGGMLHADSKNAYRGSIDIGQVIVKRELIGERRIPSAYDGDGSFLEEVLSGANVLYLPEPLSYYNAITQGGRDVYGIRR